MHIKHIMPANRYDMLYFVLNPLTIPGRTMFRCSAERMPGIYDVDTIDREQA
jgi:hypothetical protein